MDKKLLIDSYLEGKHPIEQEKWELPTESELDRDEALFDALLAERPSKSPLKGDFTSPLRGGRVGSWRGRGRLLGSIAAVLIAVVALFTWWNFKPQDQPQLAEKTEKPVGQKDTTQVIKKDNVDKSQTKHVKLANLTREVDKVNVPRSKTTRVKPAEEPQPPTEAVVLTSAADSLYQRLPGRADGTHASRRTHQGLGEQDYPSASGDCLQRGIPRRHHNKIHPIMNHTKTHTTMKKISRLSILLLGLFLALPLSAKWDTDIKELESALKCFINDKSVSLTDPRIIARGQPIDKKSINVKETDWCVDFTCTDGELVTSLWKELMGHLKNTSFFYCTDEFHPKTEPWKGLRLDEMDGVLVLSGQQKNVYVLTFEDSDGWDNGFFLTWDDLPDGGKTGYLSRKDWLLVSVHWQEPQTHNTRNQRKPRHDGQRTHSHQGGRNGEEQSEAGNRHDLY